MSKVFSDREMAYTVRSENRQGLFSALEALDPETFEVLLYPTGDLAKFTVRTETTEGAVQAINDIAPQWKHAIVRVYAEAER